MNCLHHTSAVPQPFFVVDGCQFASYLDFCVQILAYGMCQLGWWYIRANLSFSWPDMIVSMIWNTPVLFVSHLSCTTAIFVGDCCQFGPNWIFGLKIELMACADLFGGTTEQICLFLTLYDSINDMKYFWTFCITAQSCHSRFCCWLLPILP